MKKNNFICILDLKMLPNTAPLNDQMSGWDLQIILYGRVNSSLTLPYMEVVRLGEEL